MSEYEFIKIGKNAIDISGKIFNRLTVLGPIGHIGSELGWLCQCSCGKLHITRGSHLRNGNTQSCGCLSREILLAIRTTHGQASHPLYHKWMQIIDRCYNPHNNSYKNYGGRGLIVDPLWIDSPKEFCEYISRLEHCGEKNYTLDRIDNSLGYIIGNLRFATYTQQSRNRRDNRLITYNGRTQNLTAWAEELGVSPKSIRSRMKMGWDWDRIFSQKVKPRPATLYVTWQGRTQNLYQWEQELGITRGALNLRLRRGWSINKAFTEPMNPIIKKSTE